MKTRRILSVVLALMMILPMAIMGISAEDAATPPAPGTVLYEENFENGLKWTNITGSYAGTPRYNYMLAVEEDPQGGQHVHYEGLGNSGWAWLEMVPASVMQAALETGDTYTISIDLQVDYNFDWIVIGCGKQPKDKANGNWLVTRASAVEGGYSFYAESYNEGASSNKSAVKALQWGVENHIDFEINTAAGTADVYLNGVLLIDNIAIAHNTIDSVFFGVYHSYQKSGDATTYGKVYPSVFLDNLSVVKGSMADIDSETATTVFADDFESYQTTAETVKGFGNGNYNNVYENQVVTRYMNNGMYLHQKSIATTDRWSERVLVADGVTNGADKYTVTFDYHAENFKYHYAFVRLGNANVATSGSGAWINLYSTKDIYIKENYDIARGSDTTKTSTHLNGGMQKIAIEVDTVEKIVKVYVNGVLQLTSDKFDNLVSGGAITFGSDEKAVYYIDNLTVTAGGVADLPADYYGAQAAIGTNGIRFVGTLGKEYTAETVNSLYGVGFHITATYEGGEKVFDQPCEYLYNKLTGGTEEYTAADLGGKHIFAFTVRNIPAEVGTITFVVTPYFTTAAGEATGTTWTVVYDAATNTVISQTMN